jgi:hypothetical protein
MAPTSYETYFSIENVCHRISGFFSTREDPELTMDMYKNNKKKIIQNANTQTITKCITSE